MHLIDNAVEAAKSIGLVPKVAPIRGGTDGARLSFMGLPVRISAPAILPATDRMNM